MFIPNAIFYFSSSSEKEGKKYFFFSINHIDETLVIVARHHILFPLTFIRKKSNYIFSLTRSDFETEKMWNASE